MLRRALLLAFLALPAAAPPAAGAAEHVRGEVIVRYAPGTGAAARAATERAVGVTGAHAFGMRSRVLRIGDGGTVAATVAELRRRPAVAAATPNYVARAALVPNDPGLGSVPGGWQGVQWNFQPLTGVNAPAAWDNLVAAGRPGGLGVTVAVLDTGVAYRTHGRYLRSPDFTREQFRGGYDFVDRDPYPDDANGHGTHVASTIAERVDNAVGVTGLAYGAQIMPVRVLDAWGEGDIPAIADGIRYAARRGAQVINLSFEFGRELQARDIPEILSALRYAASRNVLVVGAAGNSSATSLAYPARADDVLSVGAVTEHGCQARYSNGGSALDLVAPGGGRDAAVAGDPNCDPAGPKGREIRQMTYTTGVRAFGLAGG
jgi:serine protease